MRLWEKGCGSLGAGTLYLFGPHCLSPVSDFDVTKVSAQRTHVLE